MIFRAMKEICAWKSSIFTNIFKLLVVFHSTGECDHKFGWNYKEIKLTSIPTSDERENSAENVKIMWQSNYLFVTELNLMTANAKKGFYENDFFGS